MPNPRDAGNYYIGLMSGTSMDGIDAALVKFGARSATLVASKASNYPAELRDALLSATQNPGTCAIDQIGTLDHWVGECFRDAAIDLIADTKVPAGSIRAIGSHGQTLRHQPRNDRPFTTQIGDPNIIVAGTNITTVADFRRRDLAVGGEGAPLAPAFHNWLFHDATKTRCVLNLGGIANITILPADDANIVGFDTGPANTLLDNWTRTHLNEAFDREGVWAASGTVSEALLKEMLADPYFDAPPPKSTGPEYFNAAWLEKRLANSGTAGSAAEDIQATLAELTARSVAQAILSEKPKTQELLVCGGGAHNKDLMNRLGACLTVIPVVSTQDYGLHPDWVEAVAFAWLAKRCLEGKSGNIPAVTGASSAQILGAIYPGNT